LANLMARLFHEVSGEGLGPLGISPEQFPVLVALWFGPGASRAALCEAQEAEAEIIDPLVRSLAEAGLIESFPADPNENLVLTAKAIAARDPAIAAARRANDAARAVLDEAEMDQFMEMMNRVIDGLKEANRK
ncbi:MAG: MarR family transcriptional regulator, partial [Devosia sp.]